jgi:hypothetical protein
MAAKTLFGWTLIDVHLSRTGMGGLLRAALLGFANFGAALPFWRCSACAAPTWRRWKHIAQKKTEWMVNNSAVAGIGCGFALCFRLA